MTTTKTRLYIAAVVIASVIGAVKFFRAPSSTDVADGNVVAPSVSHKDVSYAIDGQPVKLGQDGTKYFGNEAVGDFDADGDEDIAFLFSSDGGGSGTFFYVAVALKTAAGYDGTEAVFLGDRIAPQTTEFRDGRLTVNFATRNEGEPMTTDPSRGVSRSFKIADGELVEMPTN